MKMLLCLTALCLLALPLCADARSFTPDEERVLQAYLAYYGRPADPGGLEYWSGRLGEEGGNLNSIIDAFGVSQEYQDRFGNLTSTQLVINLYDQLFGREPDLGGLDYYVGQLDSGNQNLQRISLAILDGSQNEDIAIINNRIRLAEEYIALAELGVVAALSAVTLAELVSAVDDSAASLDAAIAVLNEYADVADYNLDGSWVGQEINIASNQTYEVGVQIVGNLVTTAGGLTGVITAIGTIPYAYQVAYSDGGIAFFATASQSQYLAYVEEDLAFGVLEKEAGTRPEFDYFDIAELYFGTTIETDGTSYLESETLLDCTYPLDEFGDVNCGITVPPNGLHLLFMEYGNVDALWQMTVYGEPLNDEINFLGLAAAIMSYDKRFVALMDCDDYSVPLNEAGCSFSFLKQFPE